MNYQTQTILITVGGAYAISILNLIETLRLPASTRPDIKSFIYWLINFGLNPLIAGFIGYCYVASDSKIGAINALQLGASAPLLLRGLANAAGSRS